MSVALDVPWRLVALTCFFAGAGCGCIGSLKCILRAGGSVPFLPPEPPPTKHIEKCAVIATSIEYCESVREVQLFLWW